MRSLIALIIIIILAAVIYASGCSVNTNSAPTVGTAYSVLSNTKWYSFNANFSTLVWGSASMDPNGNVYRFPFNVDDVNGGQHKGVVVIIGSSFVYQKNVALDGAEIT